MTSERTELHFAAAAPMAAIGNRLGLKTVVFAGVTNPRYNRIECREEADGLRFALMTFNPLYGE